MTTKRTGLTIIEGKIVWWDRWVITKQHGDEIFDRFFYFVDPEAGRAAL